MHYTGWGDKELTSAEIETKLITTGHDFKTKLSPTGGHEDVLVPRELGPKELTGAEIETGVYL
jgi:hypothetical protein